MARLGGGGADTEAFPLQLRGQTTQQIPRPHLAVQLSGLDQDEDSPVLWQLAPEGTSLTPGGLTPWTAGPGHRSTGCPLKGKPSFLAIGTLQLPPPPFFGGLGLDLSDTQEGEGLPGSTSANTLLGIPRVRGSREMDTLWFQGSAVPWKISSWVGLECSLSLKG